MRSPTLLLALCVGAFQPAAAAQFPPLELPAGSAGRAPLFQPFSYASGRLQSIYGGQRGKARVVVALGLRREGTLPNHLFIGAGSQDPGGARTYQDFRIRLGRGDIDNMVGTFANNHVGAPTEVFRKPVSLPLAIDQPSHPMPWAPAYEFALAVPFVHTGAGDLLVDFAVDQGALVFGAWTGGSPYLMDGWRLSRENASYGSTLGHPHCLDSAWQSGPAFVVGNAIARTAASPQLPDTLFATLSIVRSAPKGQHVIGLGVNGVLQPAQGIALGACQPLMMQPLLTFGGLADAQGVFQTVLYDGPYPDVLSGVQIFAQAAFADSKTQRFSLTHATEFRVPLRPALDVLARSKYAPAANATQEVPVPLTGDTWALSLRMR